MKIGEFFSIGASVLAPSIALTLFRDATSFRAPITVPSPSNTTTHFTPINKTPFIRGAVLGSCLCTFIGSVIENYVKVQNKERSNSEAAVNILATTIIAGAATYLGCRTSFYLLPKGFSSLVAGAAFGVGGFSSWGLNSVLNRLQD